MGARLLIWTPDDLAFALAKVDVINDFLSFPSATHNPLQENQQTDFFLSPYAIAQRHAAFHLVCRAGRISARHSDAIAKMGIDGKGIDLFDNLELLLKGMQIIVPLRGPGALDSEYEGLCVKAIEEGLKLFGGGEKATIEQVQEKRREYAERIREEPQRFRKVASSA